LLSHTRSNSRHFVIWFTTKVLKKLRGEKAKEIIETERKFAESHQVTTSRHFELWKKRHNFEAEEIIEAERKFAESYQVTCRHFELWTTCFETQFAYSVKEKIIEAERKFAES
jgi:hypothetical protein